nr:MAG TPA: hypothetical protein [Caudoviricetes sp.]
MKQTGKISYAGVSVSRLALFHRPGAFNRKLYE